jgi:hypothetical protein
LVAVASLATKKSDNKRSRTEQLHLITITDPFRADFELRQKIPERKHEMVDEKYWNDYFDTHNDRRFDDLVNDFYTEDATFENPKVQVRGRKEIIGYLMRNPEYTGHPIRFALDTESGINWTLNPVVTGQ